MVRTFIAVDIDSKNIISKLVDLQRQLLASRAQMKLVEPENIHVTLYFLGEIPEEKLFLVKNIVEKCCEGHSKFEIYISGIGAFPKPSRPRVIWAGISSGGEILSQIARCLRREFPRHGFRREDKEFHPHITLARVKRYNSQLRQEITRLSTVDIGGLVVCSIKIKKSTLTPKGPIYEDLYVIELE